MTSKNAKSSECLAQWLAADEKLVSLSRSLSAAGARAAGRDIEAARTKLAQSVERVQDKAYASLVRMKARRSQTAE
jgi:hypothetical protein